VELAIPFSALFFVSPTGAALYPLFGSGIILLGLAEEFTCFLPVFPWVVNGTELLYQ